MAFICAKCTHDRPSYIFCIKTEHHVLYHSSSTLFFLSLIFFSISMLNHHEPSSYDELLAIPEFESYREVFLRVGWGQFLASLQGHDDDVSLQFSLGFDGKFSRVGSLVFQSQKSPLLWPQNSHELETDGSSIINFHDRVTIGFLNQNIKMFLGLKDIQRGGLKMN
jgi:hypothetical protein